MSKTLKLTEWVPALAREIHGKKYTPNHDMITHLQAQQFAKMIGVKWGREIEDYNVESIKEGVRAMNA